MHVLKIASRTALLLGFAGLAAVPAAHAQPMPGPDNAGPPGHHRMMPGWHKGGERGFKPRMHQRRNVDLIGFNCGPRATERLEVTFVRLSHRLDLTEAQKPLFESLKTAALTEQTKVADVCAAAMPARGKDAERPGVVEGLKARLAIDTARVQALETVVPEFEAFFTSLTDQQKARLTPRRMRTHMGDAAPGKGVNPAPQGEQAPAERTL